MQVPDNFEKIIDRKRYSTETSTLLAGDDWWDGNNFERQGRQCFLYRTPNGAYFTVNLTQWQGEQDTLLPCTLEEAVLLYENELTCHSVSYQEAFPDVVIEEA